MDKEVRFLAQQLLHAGLARLSDRDQRVIARIARRVHTHRSLDDAFDEQASLGQRLADQVAAIGGSWRFIIGFGGFLGLWVVLNTVVFWRHPIDPYPFIFLNLLLSMLAAVQAPVIMMSQNRQSVKDRLATVLDYEVNLQAEGAIAELHVKIDRLLEQDMQWKTLTRE